MKHKKGFLLGVGIQGKNSPNNALKGNRITLRGLGDSYSLRPCTQTKLVVWNYGLSGVSAHYKVKYPFLCKKVNTTKDDLPKPS